MERAILLSQNKQLDLATDDYKRAWEISQNEGVALEYVSNLLLVNKLKQAVELLNECILKFPDNTDFRRRLAEVYSETGNADRSMLQYDTILQKDPENFEAWYDKGIVLGKMKDTAGAIDALEKSFAIQPVAYSGLALANLYSSTKNPKALQICDILIARDSLNTQTDAVYMKGVYYAETHQYEQALKQFEECIKRDWKMTDAYIEKGIVFYEQKKYDTALATFNMSITVSNTNADGYYWSGRCYEVMGDKNKAIENYERAISLDRSFTEAARRIMELKK